MTTVNQPKASSQPGQQQFATKGAPQESQHKQKDIELAQKEKLKDPVLRDQDRTDLKNQPTVTGKYSGIVDLPSEGKQELNEQEVGDLLGNDVERIDVGTQGSPQHFNKTEQKRPGDVQAEAKRLQEQTRQSGTSL